MAEWHFLTGEYPPDLGGVGDYTHQVARGLAAAGDAVHVWLPAGVGRPAAPGVELHALPGRFGPRALAALHAGLARFARPIRLVVQYTPQVFGLRSLNLPLCLWLSSRRRDAVWVMFHEVVAPVGRGLSWRANLVGRVTRTMAAVLARAADQVFVSIPAWADLVRRAGWSGPVSWWPIVSNIPQRTDPERVAGIRAALLRPGESLLIGSFGTFGANTAELLRPVLCGLLQRHAARRALLIGRGAGSFVARLAADEPALGGRLAVADSLPADAVADHLAACDLLVQPYGDGVSTRRSTLMAGLAVGRPVVSNLGFLSEPFWPTTGAVLLAPSADAAALGELAEQALRDGPRRAQLGARASALYRERFSLDRVVAAYRAAAD